MIVYAIAKYLVYSLWCYVGLRALAGQVTPLRQALGFGAVRWSLGLVLGFVVFLAVGSVDRNSLAVLYFGIYTPLRLFEWTVMTWLMLRQHPQASARVRFAGCSVASSSPSRPTPYRRMAWRDGSALGAVSVE